MPHVPTVNCNQGKITPANSWPVKSQSQVVKYHRVNK